MNIDLGKGKAKRQTTQAIPWCAFGTLLAIQGFENGDGIGSMLKDAVEMVEENTAKINMKILTTGI